MFDIFPRSITPGLTARWCLAVVTALLAALPAGIQSLQTVPDPGLRRGDGQMAIKLF